MIELTQAYLKKLLLYNPETGEFTWLVDVSKGTKKGSKAGSINGTGYVTIGIKRTYYQAHQLAFLYMEGTLAKELDHINGIRSDNRWVNLRKTIGNANRWNRKLNENSTTGIKGVYWNKANKGYTASISKDKVRHSATFKTIEEAETWVTSIRKLLHGEFGRNL